MIQNITPARNKLLCNFHYSKAFVDHIILYMAIKFFGTPLLQFIKWNAKFITDDLFCLCRKFHHNQQLK